MSDAWDGRPENPERSGRHWCASPAGVVTLCHWHPAEAECPAYWDGMGWSDPAANARRGWTYLGPALLPAEVAALTAAAEMRGREDASDAAHDAIHDAIYFIDDATLAKDAAANAIASLPPPSGATALAAMLDQARRDALEEAAAVAEAEDELPGDPPERLATDIAKRPVDYMRVAVRVSKEKIAAAIRARKETRDAE